MASAGTGQVIVLSATNDHYDSPCRIQAIKAVIAGATAGDENKVSQQKDSAGYGTTDVIYDDKAISANDRDFVHFNFAIDCPFGFNATLVTNATIYVYLE